MKAILHHPIVKSILAGSLLFYILSGVSSILNYLFYPVVARFVTTSQYGEIQFLVSMFTQLAVGFVVLNILAIIISAQVRSKQERAESLKSLNTSASLVILVIVTAGSFILYANQATLGLHEAMAIVALGLSLVINVPFTVAIGRLQGTNHFVASGVLGTLGALLKLIFSVIFIWLGFGVTGAILGIGIGMLVTLALVEAFTYFSHDSVSRTPLLPTKTTLQRLGFIRKRAIVAIGAITLVTLLSSADSIASRIWLDAHAAGQYAAVATLTKIILAATSPLMWLALPPAVTQDRSKIIRLLGLTVGVAFTACVVFSLFPVFFLTLLLGIDAGTFVNYTALASIAMALCSIAFVTVSVGICLGHLRSVTLTATIAVVVYLGTFVSVQFFAEPLVASLYSQIAASSCFILGGILSLHPRHFTSR